MGLEGEEEEDALGRRGFWDKIDLRLGAMMQLTYETQREREREREKQLENHQTRYNITKYRNLRVRMHEHVTCKFKYIIGLAQSKPNTHVKCIKHCYNAHVMQCMKI